MYRVKPDNKILLWYLKNSDTILLILAVIDLFVLAVSYFERSYAEHPFSLIYPILISVAFACDFALKFFLARERTRFARENWWQLIVIFMPFLRIVRVFLRIFVMAYRIRHGIRVLLVEKGLGILFVFIVVVAFLFSVVILLIERTSPAANITTIDQAIWWAFSTISTVGYGDLRPVTLMGKGVAIFLMFIGIAMIAMFTAQCAAFIIESDKKINEDENSELRKIRADLEKTKKELQYIKRLLKQQSNKK